MILNIPPPDIDALRQHYSCQKRLATMIKTKAQRRKCCGLKQSSDKALSCNLLYTSIVHSPCYMLLMYPYVSSCDSVLHLWRIARRTHFVDLTSCTRLCVVVLSTPLCLILCVALLSTYAYLYQLNWHCILQHTSVRAVLFHFEWIVYPSIRLCILHSITCLRQLDFMCSIALRTMTCTWRCVT